MLEPIDVLLSLCQLQYLIIGDAPFYRDQHVLINRLQRVNHLPSTLRFLSVGDAPILELTLQLAVASCRQLEAINLGLFRRTVTSSVVHKLVQLR